MKNKSFKLSVLIIMLFISSCAVTSDKELFRNSGGENLMISGRMQAGVVDIYINAEHVIKDASILDFDEIFEGKYKDVVVKAQCKHTKHFSSVENECDVYIDGQYAINLYFR